MRKFRTRNNHTQRILNIIIILLFGIFCFFYFTNSANDNFLSKIIQTYHNSRLDDVDFVLKYALNLEYQERKEDLEALKYESILEKEEEKLPLVYIYNTHQTEEYQSSFLDTYNIRANVLIASHILKENLDDAGIPTIVETDDLVNLRNSMGLKYGKSYVVSRIALEEAFKNNPSLTYFIDLHRDSGSHTKTTINFDNENYAKVLFVVGLDNPSYAQNLLLAETLSQMINERISGLSRGVLQKSGKNVNGIYNQDFNQNVMLIEVGGQNNYINEITNTLDILAQVLTEYIKDDENGI